MDSLINAPESILHNEQRINRTFGCAPLHPFHWLRMTATLASLAGSLPHVNCPLASLRLSSITYEATSWSGKWVKFREHPSVQADVKDMVSQPWDFQDAWSSLTCNSTCVFLQKNASIFPSKIAWSPHVILRNKKTPTLLNMFTPPIFDNLGDGGAEISSEVTGFWGHLWTVQVTGWSWSLNLWCENHRSPSVRRISFGEVLVEVVDEEKEVISSCS